MWPELRVHRLDVLMELLCPAKEMVTDAAAFCQIMASFLFFLHVMPVAGANYCEHSGAPCLAFHILQVRVCQKSPSTHRCLKLWCKHGRGQCRVWLKRTAWISPALSRASTKNLASALCMYDELSPCSECLIAISTLGKAIK